MRITSLLCLTDPPGIRPTSSEQAVRRWWQEGTLADGFDEYYEEPDAMTRERELWAHNLMHWCRY